MDSETEKQDNRNDNNDVQQLQATLFPTTTTTATLDYQLPRLLSAASSGHFLFKTGHLELEGDGGGAQQLIVTRLKEPRDLFACSAGPPQPVRWPAECQVLDERIIHNFSSPPIPERYYLPTGREAQPKPLGDEFGTTVYEYHPIGAINYFNRSCVGGNNKYNNSSSSSSTSQLEMEDLQFESRFECGNLAKAIKLTANYYELYIRADMYTNKHTQWFYFKVMNMKSRFNYRFAIVNLSKGESLYATGMKPLMYSTKDDKLHAIGWRRCGDNISYFSNENGNGEEDQLATYTLTFTVEFPYDNDSVYFAHSYPYTYSDLQDYLTTLANHQVKSIYTTVRLLCRSLAGNNVYYVTITSPPTSDSIKKKKAIVLSGRVHPGESPSSWIMKGILDFLTSETNPARDLRDKFIFKLIPMLNPDGVIVGNSRCSLTGRDLNRQYRTVLREMYPPVWYTKLMVRRLIEDCGVALYCDIHAHSRQNNVFIYGCENRRNNNNYEKQLLQEQVFPLMLHKNAADKFSFEHCKFRIQRCKEGTSRVVMWMMGIANSYTMEASFAGTDLSGGGGGGGLLKPNNNCTHFTINDYEQMGRTFCLTLLDFYDESLQKQKLRNKILKRLLKEGSSADEPVNINLSEYSSDTSSDGSDDQAVCLIVPPPSPNNLLSSSPKVMKKKKKKKLPVIKKHFYPSPTLRRKVLPMYCTTVGLSLIDSETSSESDTDSPNRIRKPKSSTYPNIVHVMKKQQQKSKQNVSVLKLMSDQDDDDDEKFLSHRSIVKLPITRAYSKIHHHSYHNGTLRRRSTVHNTTHQLAQVQAKLMSLRHRIWKGTETEVDQGEPLSWGYSNFVQTHSLLSSLQIKKNKKNNKVVKKVKPKPKSPDRRKRNETKNKKLLVQHSNTDTETTTTTTKTLRSLHQNSSSTINHKAAAAAAGGGRRIATGTCCIGESDLDQQQQQQNSSKKKKIKKKKKRRKINWQKTVKTVTMLIHNKL